MQVQKGMETVRELRPKEKTEETEKRGHEIGRELRSAGSRDILEGLKATPQPAGNREPF